MLFFSSFSFAILLRSLLLALLVLRAQMLLHLLLILASLQLAVPLTSLPGQARWEGEVEEVAVQEHLEVVVVEDRLLLYNLPLVEVVVGQGHLKVVVVVVGEAHLEAAVVEALLQQSLTVVEVHEGHLN